MKHDQIKTRLEKAAEDIISADSEIAAVIVFAVYNDVNESGSPCGALSAAVAGASPLLEDYAHRLGAAMCDSQGIKVKRPQRASAQEN